MNIKLIKIQNYIQNIIQEFQLIPIIILLWIQREHFMHILTIIK
jgi:hypothetical protein